MARKNLKPQAKRVKSGTMTVEQIIKLATMSYIAAHEASQLKIDTPASNQVAPTQAAIIAPQEYWYYNFENEKLNITNSLSTDEAGFGPFPSFSQAKMTALKHFTNLAAQARKITKS
jgi:hypothetical protein